MRRVREVTKVVRDYDPCLYAMEMPDGRIDIYRKNRENISPPHFIFSLTDTWQPSGRKVDWGVDPILNRIRAHDLWRDDGFVESWIADDEKRAESRDRSRRSGVEDFLYDFRGQFNKTFNDVNTSNMNKISKKEN